MARRFLLLFIASLTVAAAVPALATADQPWGPDDSGVPYDDGGWAPDGGTTTDETTVTTVPGSPPAVTMPPQTTTPTPTPTPPSVPVPTTPVAPELPAVTMTNQPMVKGRVAVLRHDGKVAIPHGAPKLIRNIIRAANEIIGKPYKWGGGHARLIDRGYDCSGSVSYALIRNRLLRGPLVSGQLAHTFAPGPGRWLTIYANKTHVYMEVAGVRFDTSPVADWWSGRDGVRWRPLIGKRKGFHVRHLAGL